MEEGGNWSGPSGPETWAATYGIESQGVPYYDYGSANSCPAVTAAGQNPNCDNSWNESDVWEVSAGTYVNGKQISIPFPEIYYPGDSADWVNVATYGWYNTGKHANFAGAFSEDQATGGAGNTPTQAWDQLYSALNSNQITAQSSLPYESDITWDDPSNE
jgi:hypothetical protein